jgi:hypothetical protein
VRLEAHSILVLARPGECWRCTCGRWWFASVWPLDDEGVAEVLRNEFAEHKRFEEIYG